MSAPDSQESSAAPSVSAIVVSYFTGPLLARCLASLKAQPEVREIILVDNGNWPNAAEDAAASTPSGAPVRVLSPQGNVGFAAGCNLGAKEATGSHLLFINPDATAPSGAVGRLIADGAALARPWVIGAKIVDPDGVEQRGSRRMTLTPWRAFVEATKLYKIAPKHPYFRRFNLHDDPCPGEVTPVPAISGACFFLPRDDFFAIGGMDEAYFLHAEDLDFCVRFLEAGGVVYFDPFVAVPHFKSSSRANPLRIEARKTASLMRYFRSHFSENYPAPFMALVGAALWTALAAKAVKRGAQRMASFIAGSRRLGFDGARRARDIAAKRSVR